MIQTVNRKKILRDLLIFKKPLVKIKEKLINLSWDSEEELILLKKESVLNILNRYIKGKLKEKDLEEWANLIESREDIGYEEKYEKILSDIIYSIANPALYGKISKDEILIWKKKLQKNIKKDGTYKKRHQNKELC